MKLVMIIEDEFEIRSILQETLELVSYKTMTAANGKEALDILLKTKNLPNLILLDLMMPVMNGWEFVTEIKKHPTLAKIPILVVSAFGYESKSIDCQGFIEKPLILNNLLSLVEQHLS